MQRSKCYWTVLRSEFVVLEVSQQNILCVLDTMRMWALRPTYLVFIQAHKEFTQLAESPPENPPGSVRDGGSVRSVGGRRGEGDEALLWRLRSLQSHLNPSYFQLLGNTEIYMLMIMIKSNDHKLPEVRFVEAILDLPASFRGSTSFLL